MADKMCGLTLADRYERICSLEHSYVVNLAYRSNKTNFMQEKCKKEGLETFTFGELREESKKMDEEN